MFKNAERQTSKDRIAKEFPEQITVIKLVFIYSKELLKQKRKGKENISNKKYRFPLGLLLIYNRT